MGDLAFSRERLFEKVANFLRKKILLNEYPHGLHLSEVQLSEDLAVSRGPVREALKILENEGLVETFANGRSVVVGLSKKDLHDLFEVRRTLETTAIQIIVEQGYGANIYQQFDRILKGMRTETEQANLIQLDVDYHFELLKLSQNRALSRAWLVFRNVFKTLIEITTDLYGELGSVTDVHEKILQAIAQSSTSIAIETLSYHLITGEMLMSERLY